MNLTILRLILVVLLYFKISYNDFKTFKIPNYLLIIMSVFGIIINYIEYSFFEATILILISIVFFVIFAYLCTLKFKGIQFFGAGDLKLIIATFISIPFLSGIFTNIFIFNVLVYTSILSFIYSVFILIKCKFNLFEFGKKLYEIKIPYSLFLFLGVITSIIVYFFI